MRNFKCWAILLLGVGAMLPAADRLRADEAGCAVVSAGAATEAVTGSVLNIGQVVIGQVSGASGAVHAGAMYCLRAHGAGSPPGDCDNDGDLDLADYDVFHTCVSGPGGGLPGGCECHDVDGDSDVDLFDFSEFQVGFSG